jgi:hypothetical protein
MAKKLSDRSPGVQLIVFLVAKLGMADAIRVATFVVQWGTVARKLHKEPTWPEYCAYWRESRATYYRDLKLFRRAWPMDKSPHRVWQWVEANVPKVAEGESPEDAVAVLLTLAVP